MNAICTQEDFQELGSKPYRNIPRSLLLTIIKELPDYAALAYLVLYDLSQLNQKHPGTVLASYFSLAKELDKSVRSIGRALRTLKNLGYITYQEKIKSYHTVNIIEVRCPQTVAERINREEKDRNSVVRLIAVNNKAAARTDANKFNQQSLNKIAGIRYNTNNFQKSDNEMGFGDNASLTNSTEQLYEQYQQHLKTLRAQGIAPLAASKQAFLNFNETERTVIQRHILNQAHSVAADQANHASDIRTKMTEGQDKNVRHIRINNNRLNTLLLTIDKSDPKDNSPPCTSRHESAIVQLKNERKADDVSLQRATVIKKLRAMHRSGEIHHQLTQKYSLGALISEVLVHTKHPNPNRISGFKHALNAAAKMIRAGTWSTPKRLLHEESLQREQARERFKQQEKEAVQMNVDGPFRSLMSGIRYALYH